MCGVSGLIELDGRPADRAAVERMTVAMLHRGPDSAGFLQHGPAVFGMRRLAIIDLASGDQPIFNEDGTVGVISNGEIYNFHALMAELEGLGHRFRSRCDTEVLVHAYEQWGAACVQRLRGMFAFAVCDARAAGPPTVFLARDRFGIKPLYFYTDGQRLLFASEVRAL